jgi:gamma-glutamylaminecyclotransferase
MLVRLFVYGTLKEGFPNHHFNTGRRLPGVFRTRQAFPLLVVRLANEDRAPWLVNQPGHGFQVLGQVFEVAASALPAIDRLEELGQPTGYVRDEIELHNVDDPSTPVRAFAYLKPEHHLCQCLAQEGPFSDYTLQLAQGYWLTAA